MEYDDDAGPARPTPARDVNEPALLPFKMRAVLTIQPQGDHTSMTVLRGVAIQLDTFARNGALITTRLLPMRQVRGLFIHEVLTMGRIATVLALAVDGDPMRPLQLVFDAVPLRLVQQQAILRDQGP
ncbi:hypothetical protein GGF32_008599 [Allomyces javanicus]|nr:hypothetical protein GGF32_008599 [Allomyces javanicus]